jgi:hypothetical protein
MKKSVVIPSTDKHFKYLDKVFLSYVDQTMKPEEIVVSIANGHLVNKEEIRKLKNKYSEYFENVEIILHNRVVPEGPNRGEGTKVASNELIMYNDSDDLAHPQRVEIVQQCFDSFDINHLNHGYSFEEKFNTIEKAITVESQTMFDLLFPEFVSWDQKDRVRKNRPRKVYGPLGNSLPYGCRDYFDMDITGGSLCILKSVTDVIKWEWNMDVSYDYDFCMDTLFYFNKSMLIDAALIWYNKTGNMEWYNV